MVSTTVKKLNKIEQNLNNFFKARSESIRGGLLGIISYEHVFLLGGAGLAKTALVEGLLKSIEGSQLFSLTFSKGTTENDLFGPQSLTAFREGRYERETDGMLPTATHFFGDEIFEANIGTLNAMLKVLNERKYKHGSQEIDIPLRTAFGASNRIPDVDEGSEERSLAALYDRLLLRYIVEPLPEDKFLEMLAGDESFEVTETVTLDEIETLHNELKNIAVSEDVLEALATIRSLLAEKNHPIAENDRRWKKLLKVLRANALLEGRSEVTVAGDFPVLEAGLWTSEKDKGITGEVLGEFINEYKSKIELILLGVREAAEMIGQALGSEQRNTVFSFLDAAKAAVGELDKLAGDSSEDQDKVKTARQEVENMMDQVQKQWLSL